MPLEMYRESPVTKPLERVGSIIAVAAGKGGVGKSTIAVNIARALDQMGRRVALLDGDLYGPSLRKMLPETQLPARRGDLLLPAECGRLAMVSFAFFRRDSEAAIVRAPIANSVVDQLLNQIDWGERDYLIIDCPPGTGDILMTLCQRAPLKAALMVTTPQEISLLDVRKALHFFRQLHVPIAGIIENMTGDIFGRGGGRTLSEESKTALLGEVPLDPLLSRCSDRGESLFEEESGAADLLKRCFLQIAEKLEAQLKGTIS